MYLYVFKLLHTNTCTLAQKHTLEHPRTHTHTHMHEHSRAQTYVFIFIQVDEIIFNFIIFLWQAYCIISIKLLVIEMDGAI